MHHRSYSLWYFPVPYFVDMGRRKCKLSYHIYANFKCFSIQLIRTLYSSKLKRIFSVYFCYACILLTLLICALFLWICLCPVSFCAHIQWKYSQIFILFSSENTSPLLAYIALRIVLRITSLRYEHVVSKIQFLCAWEFYLLKLYCFIIIYFIAANFEDQKFSTLYFFRFISKEFEIISLKIWDLIGTKDIFLIVFRMETKCWFIDALNCPLTIHDFFKGL